MAFQLINLKKLTRDLATIERKLGKIVETATVRTLNIIATRSRAVIANDVNEDTGISKGTAKRRIEIVKAKKNNFRALLLISAERVTYPSPRQLRAGGKLAGVSFVGSGKKRRKITSEITTDKGKGTVPFVIRGKHSGKKLSVYVLPQFRKGKTAQARRVRALYFSSLAHVARKDWQEKVDDFSIKEFKKEYPKQLKKSKFRGKF